MKDVRDKIIILILLLAVLFLCYGSVVFSASEISISAKAAVLYEPTTGSFLYTKNADKKLPMASTTKIMTALVAIENCNLDEIVLIDERSVGIEGSSLYLKAGEEMTMRNLLTGLMLRSANDAAAAIAYKISGSIDEFATLMNNKAYELGLKNTNFKNPHGLDDEGHYTSARDLAILSATALENKIFREISSAKKEKITNSDGEVRLVCNHNKLLSLYDGAIGIKTGYTKRSGRCLVGAAERDGLRFIAVTINAPDDWNDHKKLFDYGYASLRCYRVEAGEFRYSLPLIGGKNDFLTVTNKDAFSIVIPKNANEIKSEIKLNKYAVAPIKQGEHLGKIFFTLDGETIGVCPLVSQYNEPLQKRLSKQKKDN